MSLAALAAAYNRFTIQIDDCAGNEKSSVKPLDEFKLRICQLSLTAVIIESCVT
jgi:hypothetical protein